MTPEVSSLAPRDLEYIIAVAEYKNFRLASKACAVSQPALSAQIKKVEAALDVQIFERTNRKVLVTSVGEKIVEQSRNVLEELEKLGSIARGAGRPLSGQLRVGVIPTLSPYLMPKIVKPLKRKHPALDFVLREAVSTILLEWLRIGKLDAVIATSPISERSGRFKVSPLFKEPLVVVRSSKGAAGFKEPVLVEQLFLADMVLLDEQHSITQQIYSMVGPSEDAATPHVYTTSVASMLLMVESSERYAVAPAMALDFQRNIKGLQVLSFAEPIPKREVCLVWRPRYYGARALELLAGEIRAILEKKNSILELN